MPPPLSTPSLSGLQKDVLKLYRALLRSARQKTAVSNSPLEKLVQKRFREDAKSVHRHEWQTIEHLLRQGYKQKKVMEMPGFSTANLKTFEH